ncbi:hypothetical protein Sjap_013946 [Stephania japonica]|uniref:RBR-type E3 ubiquitin transferase n=1 Tax=Stephania japonica TaxID=461633 RepID=A0AAP0NZI2_9MAGN
MDEDEIDGLLVEQKRKLMAAMDHESDHDLAFRLQLQEAMAASLALHPSSSSSSSSSTALPRRGDPLDFADFDLGSLKLDDEFHRERTDSSVFEVEKAVRSTDLKRQMNAPESGTRFWEGSCVERPHGEGCPSSSSSSSRNFGDRPLRLYFKGLVSEADVEDGTDGRNYVETVAAIGVAICDVNDNLLMKIQKPLDDDSKNHRIVELKALIEGLKAAISMDVKRINFYCVNPTIYKQITGRWTVKQRKIATLINQVHLLQGKFQICRPLLVAGHDVKYVFKFVRDAWQSHIMRSPEISSADNSNETCTICLEDADASEMFAVDGCSHCYCFSCMKQHVEVKVLHGMLPGCPHDGCKTVLKLDSCRKFLSPKFVEMMSHLLKENAIPVTEKIYCPYPKCSTLMSKREVLEYANNIFNDADRSGVRKCVKCHGLFCINCKAPWHSNMSCNEYKRSNPRAEDAKLKSLASQKLWRQCVKCNHMIELAEGCYHMTCRCGYEFCYTCGAEWKNKKATCSCPLWNEANIMHEYEEDDFYDEDDDDYYEYDEFDYDDFTIRMDDDLEEFRFFFR